VVDVGNDAEISYAVTALLFGKEDEPRTIARFVCWIVDRGGRQWTRIHSGHAGGGGNRARKSSPERPAGNTSYRFRHLSSSVGAG